MSRPLAGSCSTMPAPCLPALKMKYAVFTKLFFPFRYQFPLSSHCSQLHTHPHHSFHFFATSRSISPHCIVFYCAVGVVCSGLLVGCVPPVRAPFLLRLFFHSFFPGLPCHDHVLLLVNTCSFFSSLFVSRLYHFASLHSAKGFAFQAPEYIIYFSHTPFVIAL